MAGGVRVCLAGGTVDAERRRHVYALAQRWDLLLLEDDPYFFLQFTPPMPTYLSMDADGRVLRFDSVSKILSSVRLTPALLTACPTACPRLAIASGYLALTGVRARHTECVVMARGLHGRRVC